MKRSLILLIAIAGVAAVLAIYALTPKESHKMELYNTTLDMDYFDKFKQIIEGETSPKEKEEAILNMAQFAIMLNDTDRVVDYLKSVATSAENETVIAAAYAAIDLIRDYYPLEPIGELIAKVDGELKPNSSVKIIATVKGYKDCNGSVGIVRFHQNLDHQNLEVTSNPLYKFNLSSQEKRDFTFELIPKEGENTQLYFYFSYIWINLTAKKLDKKYY